uniref:Uncharacterized protein n=1 Tax=Myotis myotis TaxID=51298 RepID=A0A7J7R4Q5_MYOMY|nr:hypothetical protein mMyoMyo1_010900 [Myotis myotis]
MARFLLFYLYCREDRVLTPSRPAWGARRRLGGGAREAKGSEQPPRRCLLRTASLPPEHTLPGRTAGPAPSAGSAPPGAAPGSPRGEQRAGTPGKAGGSTCVCRTSAPHTEQVGNAPPNISNIVDPGYVIPGSGSLFA